MPSTATETTTCVACTSPNLRRLRHSERHGFDVGRCGDCGMVSVLDPPPAAEVSELYSRPERELRYVERLRDDADAQERVLAELGRLVGGGVLFDVGAGTGEFLERVAAGGVFEARGNDLSESTAEFARRRRGVDVSTVPLSEQPAASVDVVTMWCVLAHVADPAAFLSEAASVLRPGGVLFLRTPRWCAIDVAASALARVGVSRVADRRVNRRHMHVFDEDNLGVALSSAGFETLSVEPVCHYGFSAGAYLESMGRRRWGAGVLDAAIDRGWFVRNTLFAYARKS